MATPRLSPALLKTLDASIQPRYERAACGAGIVHLGIGAFHRAHQAVYTEAVLNTLGGNWRIIGCSLRSDTVQKQLNPQTGLYTLLEKGVQTQLQIVGAQLDVLVAPENPQAVVDTMSLPNIKVVTLTVTEKGYCHHPATGDLNLEHPDILHDLSNPMSPKTVVGLLVAACRQRKQQGNAGLTCLSCDNLPHNGKVLQKVVQQFAQHVSPELNDWIDRNVTFPCSMVDRIVPATTPEDIATLEQLAGFHDEGLVVAEPFSQWVIEDNFCQGRPEWERVGALLVDDVAVYENMKLRLLNGSHSLLAYAGYLGGFETIHQVMEDALYRALCQRFMQQAAITLSVPQGFNINTYQQQLLERFSNPGLKHRTWQIAMDGSQKVPQRWLASLRDLLSMGEDVQIMALALAAWMRYVTGVDENGQTIDISDPYASTFKKLYEKNQSNIPAYVKSFFELTEIFDADLAQNTALITATQEYLVDITEKGIKTVVAAFGQ